MTTLIKIILFAFAKIISHKHLNAYEMSDADTYGMRPLGLNVKIASETVMFAGIAYSKMSNLIGPRYALPTSALLGASVALLKEKTIGHNRAAIPPIITTLSAIGVGALAGTLRYYAGSHNSLGRAFQVAGGSALAVKMLTCVPEGCLRVVLGVGTIGRTC